MLSVKAAFITCVQSCSHVNACMVGHACIPCIANIFCIHYFSDV